MHILNAHLSFYMIKSQKSIPMQLVKWLVMNHSHQLAKVRSFMFIAHFHVHGALFALLKLNSHMFGFKLPGCIRVKLGLTTA